MCIKLRNFASGELGLTRVAAVPTAATGVIPLAIQRLRAKRPTARVDLRDTDSTAVVHAVFSGTVEFGIDTLTSARPGLIAEALLEDSFILVCRASKSGLVIEIGHGPIPAKLLRHAVPMVQP